MNFVNALKTGKPIRRATEETTNEWWFKWSDDSGALDSVTYHPTEGGLEWVLCEEDLLADDWEAQEE